MKKPLKKRTVGNGTHVLVKMSDPDFNTTGEPKEPSREICLGGVLLVGSLVSSSVTNRNLNRQLSLFALSGHDLPAGLARPLSLGSQCNDLFTLAYTNLVNNSSNLSNITHSILEWRRMDNMLCIQLPLPTRPVLLLHRMQTLYCLLSLPLAQMQAAPR